MRFGARLGRLAAGLLAVALAVFALSARLPGGSENAYLGSHALDPAARGDLRRDLHLDSSPPLAFVHFVADAVRGDLGRSPVSRVDVGTVVGERLLASLAFAAGTVAGVLLATWPGRRWRRRR
ncbi:MAG: Binding-prot-dependent transport system rane comp, N-term, partial [Actinomycetota bacterium]|nr:Binding-prot-dependent transport system rane comp, N-term [Actinomycetota bacterium]